MRARWDRRRVIAVAIGGAMGAGLRWSVLVVWMPQAGHLPWPVLAVNAMGSFVLGVLLAEEWRHPSVRLILHDAGAIGVCGGLTTFSTFTLEIVNLIRAGDAALAVAYGVVSVVVSLAAILAGASLLRRVRALTLPLEERP